MAALDLAGLWVPLVTPFDEDDRVDVASLERLCRRTLADGATGVVALGTTGEPATLDPDERDLVVGVCSRVCGELGRPLIVGVGTNSTRVTAEAARALGDVAAVVGALVVVPYYTRPSVAGVVAHFAEVAERSPVPVIAYNVPYRCGVGLDAAGLIEVARLPNVVGVKQAVGSLDTDTLEVLRRAPTGFQVLSGDDTVIAPMVLMGAVGAIAASAHLCTAAFVEMIAVARRGDAAATRRLAERLLPVVVAAFAEPNPALFKAALHASGELVTAAVRAPLTAASAPALRRLVDAIRGVDAIGAVDAIRGVDAIGAIDAIRGVEAPRPA